MLGIFKLTALYRDIVKASPVTARPPKSRLAKTGSIKGAPLK